MKKNLALVVFATLLLSSCSRVEINYELPKVSINNITSTARIMPIVPVDISSDSIEKISFEPQNLIKINIDIAGNATLLHHGVEKVYNINLAMNVAGINDPIYIAHLDSLAPLSEYKFAVKLDSATRYLSSLDSTKIITLPGKVKGSQFSNLQIISPDTTIQKLKTITAKWKFTLSHMGNTGNWMAINPVHIKWLIRFYTNSAYCISQPGFLENMYKTYITNNAGTPLNNNQKKEIHNNLLNKIFKLGVVAHVSGLGGGNFGSTTATIGAAPYVVNRQFGNVDGQEVVWHELGHCDGFNHSSTMTYPFSKDTFVVNSPGDTTFYKGVYRGFSSATKNYINTEFILKRNLPYLPTKTASTKVDNSQTAGGRLAGSSLEGFVCGF